ncbi:MAG TPA: aconitase X catalytic domain-containing protein [Candidatus Eisenbacteria bacterium]|nr:aconitase X catalytic domain-containing protein [Candidatus Eisenbacteria bacterium]
MYLTKEEEKAYDGEHGWANQTCMKILVRLGELYGASKLIPASSAHVSGVSYKTLGDSPIDFLKAMADAGGKVSTRATLNPQSLDPEYLKRKVKPELVTKQFSIIEQFSRMGFTPSLTCTPYYLKKSKAGSHIAWAESSAVVYANSLLKSWTNREGGPSALAAAITGKTPDYGVHKAENRQPRISVTVDNKLQNETEYGALGVFLGRILGDKIPLIKGLENASEIGLKQLGAGLASTGMVNMFQRTAEKPERKTRYAERVTVETKDMKKTIEGLSTSADSKPDLVFVGCPHCSVREIQHVAALIKNKKVKSGIEFWVCASQCVKEQAGNAVEKIEKSGGHVLTGVCMVVSWTEALGIRTIMTNSAKTAYYAPTLNKAEAMLVPVEECVHTAFRG